MQISRIKNNDFLEESTKEKAIIKLSKMGVKMGYPDKVEEIYNKTDKKRLLIEIECNSAPLTVLNKLFASTNLQKSFSANQMALVSKTPKMLNLKNYLDIYINHNIISKKKQKNTSSFTKTNNISRKNSKFHR